MVVLPVVRQFPTRFNCVSSMAWNFLKTGMESFPGLLYSLKELPINYWYWHNLYLKNKSWPTADYRYFTPLHAC